MIELMVVEFGLSDGCIYEGEFKNDHIEGTRIYQWPDKFFYNGELKNDQIEGSGVYKWSDGDNYEGGNIKMVTKKYENFYFSKRRYLRKWKTAKNEGSWVYKWPNGDTYDGI